MSGLRDLACRDENGDFRVVVEAPRGSRVKLHYEPAGDVFVFGRTLPKGLAYPYDWGFVAGTTADDGDPLDAIVIGDYATWPGVVIPARALGIIRVSQLPRGTSRGKARRQRNDRVVAVAVGDTQNEHTRRIPERLVRELEAFFLSASKLPRDRVTIEGWSGAREARAAIAGAERRFHDGRSR